MDLDNITIIRNAIIYPSCEKNVSYSSLVISGNRIVAVGEASIPSFWEKYAHQVYDLGGQTILPGFTDAHIHLEKYAHSLDQVDCETDSLEECLERVRNAAENTPPGDWIRGHGWDQNKWGRFGTATELDAVAPENPVYLTAKSLHAAWANLRALHLSKVAGDTESKSDERIGRNPDGTLSGILFEDAMQLVAERIPRPTLEQTRSAIAKAQSQLLRFGITSVHDFDGQRCFLTLQELKRNGNLHIRVLKNVQLEQFEAARKFGIQTGFGDDWLRIGHLKLFSDGALGPQTAAMLRPYESQPDNNGMLLLTEDEIVDIGFKASSTGIPLTIHAIGDLACRTVIKALNKLNKLTPTPSLPHRIEHLQVIHPADLENLIGSNITISMQPLHAPSDHVTAMRYWGDRSRWSYAWKSVQKTESLLIFGSDAPVETPDPFQGLYAALTRKLDLETSLKAYTVNPPIAVGYGDRLGRLEPGYKADLILLDRNPFEIEVANILESHVLGAMTGGVWRFLDI
jgi:predicted amidohydrolase YtcJ